MKLHANERLTATQPFEVGYARSSRDWIRPAWMSSCLYGSVIGMTISASMAALVASYLAGYRSGTPRVVAIELMVLAATMEGALIGYFQWRVLRRLFPTMTVGPWLAATMFAAGFGCVLSWLPTSLALTILATGTADVTAGPTAIAKLSVVTGALIGLVWGLAQYVVLRLHVHRGSYWILASMVAWAMSFGWLYLAAVLPDRTTSFIVQVALGAWSGMILGLALGALQGFVLVGLHSRLLATYRVRRAAR